MFDFYSKKWYYGPGKGGLSNMETRIITGLANNQHPFYVTKEKVETGWRINPDRSLYPHQQDELKMILNHLAKQKIRNVKISNSNRGTVIVELNRKTVVLPRYSTLRKQPVFNELTSSIDTYMRRKQLSILGRPFSLKRVKRQSKDLIRVGTLLVASLGIALTINALTLPEQMTNDQNIKTQNRIMLESLDQQARISIMSDKLLDLVQIARSTNEVSSIETLEWKQKDSSSIDIPNRVLNLEEKIDFYATMYSIDKTRARELVEEAKEDIVNSENQERALIALLRYEHWDDYTIDKTPITGVLTKEEKEEWILYFADVYGLTAEEKYTLLAIHRLETGHGEELDKTYPNNQGGVYDPKIGDFATYKTAQIGCESLVRTFINNCKLAKVNPYYDETKSVAYNLNPTYCTDNSPYVYNEIKECYEQNHQRPETGFWYEVVDSLVKEVKQDYGIQNNITKS